VLSARPEKVDEIRRMIRKRTTKRTIRKRITKTRMKRVVGRTAPVMIGGRASEGEEPNEPLKLLTALLKAGMTEAVAEAAIVAKTGVTEEEMNVMVVGAVVMVEAPVMRLLVEASVMRLLVEAPMMRLLVEAPVMRLLVAGHVIWLLVAGHVIWLLVAGRVIWLLVEAVMVVDLAEERETYLDTAVAEMNSKKNVILSQLEGEGAAEVGEVEGETDRNASGTTKASTKATTKAMVATEEVIMTMVTVTTPQGGVAEEEGVSQAAADSDVVEALTVAKVTEIGAKAVATR
jgi:hypothetical protein